MKKSMVIGVILLLALLMVGCLDYKAYNLPQKNDEANLIDEIAQIEEQLQEESEASAAEAQPPAENGAEETEAEAEETEEVLLPELGTEGEETVETESLETIAVKENELVRLKVKITDPDKDQVTYTFSKPLNVNGEWKTNYGDAGEYVVSITASDGRLTTEKKVKIVVERVNVPPVVEPLRDIAVREGDVVDFTPKVSDPNKDLITTTVSEPLSSGKFTTDHTSAGEYQISVVATDGELQTENAFRLVVQDVNVKPEVSNLPEMVQVKEGDVVQLKPVVTDLDNDPLTVKISEPVGDGGVWQTGYTDHGVYVVTVTVTDGKDTVVNKVKLTVEDVNKPPQIEDIFLG